MLFFLFFQLIELRLILLNERPLIGRLNITQTLSHTNLLVTFRFDSCEANHFLSFFLLTLRTYVNIGRLLTTPRLVILTWC